MAGKLTALWLCLLIVSISAAAFSEAGGEPIGLPDLSGVWTDPDWDGAELVILHDMELWTDERMGEPVNGGYAAVLHWTVSADSFDSYRMTCTPEEYGLSYANGLYVACSSEDSEEDVSELLEDSGTGSFRLTEAGSLLWEDSYVASASDMEFCRTYLPAPDAKTLVDGYFLLTAGYEEETAGASLKLAETVCGLYDFCEAYGFWMVDREELGRNMLEAYDMLSTKEKEAADAGRSAVLDEALRLTEEEEDAGSAYEDAGVAERMEALRTDPVVRSCVLDFVSCAAVLENSGGF